METLKEKYYEILIRGGSLTGLCNLTAGYTGTPVAITLTTRTILRKSSDYTKELTEEYTKAFAFLDREDTVEDVKEMNRLLLSGEPFARMWTASRYKRINCGCFLEGKLAAVIDCPVLNGQVPEHALEVVKLASGAFTAALLMTRVISRKMSHPLQSYVAAVLCGESYDMDQMRNFHDSYVDRDIVWRVIWTAPKPSGGQKDLHDIVDLFCGLNSGFIYVGYKDGYVLLMDQAYEKNFRQFVALGKNTCYISVSEAFTDLQMLGKMLEMARSALKIAQLEGAREDVVRVERYKAAMIYLSGYRKPPAAVQENMLTDRIKQYDARHRSEYYETIKEWLLNDSSVSKVAGKLDIHPNTVGYRLKKISEIFAIDLHDCHVITELYLSLLVDLQNRRQEGGCGKTQRTGGDLVKETTDNGRSRR